MLGEAFNTTRAPIAFLDLEMTGLEPMKHEIVEIALVRVAQPSLDTLEEWSVKVKPEHIGTADPVSLTMIGYSEEAWQDAVSLQEAMEQFVAKTDHHIIAGWNCAYDWAFLEAAMEKTNTVTHIHKRILDVMAFAYGKLWPRFPLSAMGLMAVCRQLNIALDHHHQALADTQATATVYKNLVQSSKSEF